MKKIFLLLLLVLFVSNGQAQHFGEPWTSEQLMTTATLASKMKRNQMQQTIVINIGPDALIKYSHHIGPTNNPENLEKLKDFLATISKNKEVVLYCGCCPFDICPNIRPAFQLLMDAGFLKGKLLDIPKNIKTDWIAKGYPVKE